MTNKPFLGNYGPPAYIEQLSGRLAKPLYFNNESSKLEFTYFADLTTTNPTILKFPKMVCLSFFIFLWGK